MKYKIKTYYLSNKKMTISVDTVWNDRLKEDMIVATAPIAKKFIGQPLSNLKYWMGTNAIKIN